MMSFLTAVVTSRYPTTNKQLRNSSNPRQQATINDGRVTLQPVQGRQTYFVRGTTRTYTPGASGSNSGKQMTVICYNCKGEGHMSKQCTKPKRKRDDSWFKDKVLLVQAQANGQIYMRNELHFWQIQELQKVKPHTMSFTTMLLIKPMIWMHMTLIVMNSTLPQGVVALWRMLSLLWFRWFSLRYTQSDNVDNNND
ncbi:integrase, catalytic region, zinc finger, CCHC-type containing protein [Tanacetum coccineum]